MATWTQTELWKSQCLLISLSRQCRLTRVYSVPSLPPSNCLHCFRTCELLAKSFTIRFEEQQAHLRYTVDQIFFRSSLSVLRYTQAGVDHIKTSVYALWTCVHSRLCIYTRENYAECERGVESHLGVVTRRLYS